MALNTEQQEAVAHFGTPLLIIAGAGSGKTTVLTHKMVYLIEALGFPAPSILAITFTNKAAKEMNERVHNLLKEKGIHETPYISTFHAFCGDVLRHFFNKIGGSNDFIIFDAYDQNKLMKQILKECNLDDKKYPPAKLLGQIEGLKNKLIGFKTYSAQGESDEILAKVYTLYQQRLWQNKAVDFGDMLFWANVIFQHCPDVLSYYQNRFHYVMVDEYQDTNHSQYMLIKQMTAQHHNLCVVGDFDQNIYSWRGANIQNILRFEKDFKDASVIKLEENYRSTGNILKVANHIIQFNKNRRDKNLWTREAEGKPVLWLECQNEYEEGAHILAEIKAHASAGIPYKNHVILFRLNALSRSIEDRLTKEGIPYQLIGATRFFDRKEIKDILGYLRVVHNPHDNLSFARIANVPTRGISQATVETLMARASKEEKSIYDLCKEPIPELGTRAIGALSQFWALIEGLRQEAQSQTQDIVAHMIKAIYQNSGYRQMLEAEESLQSQDRMENIQELMSSAREEELSLGEFLNKMTLSTDMDSKNTDEDTVLLMSMHSAKGLEFDYVYIIGLEEGILPHYRAFNSQDELEEERRLAYVGITRGKKEVTLSSCRTRTFFGDLKSQIASRFYEELPKENIEERQSPSLRTTSTWKGSGASTGISIKDMGRSSTPPPAAESSAEKSLFKQGMQVTHAAWGVGTIVRMDGVGENAILHIAFRGSVKKLIAKYAPVVPVSVETV